MRAWMMMTVVLVFAAGCATQRPSGRPGELRRITVATPDGERSVMVAYSVNSIGMEFVRIPAGGFVMGSNGGAGNEKPAHVARIARPLLMGAHEVTQEQYRIVMGRNPAHFKGPKLPVERVAWHDAIEFCRRLSEMDGVTYRLPTEAEWEYACRAGTFSPFYVGDTISSEQANYEGHYIYGDGKRGEYRVTTTPVGSFAPNAFGLYDMHGNVSELCQSLYKAYPYRRNDGREDLRSAEGRVVRGGAWVLIPWSLRSSARFRCFPGFSDNSIGFRVCADRGLGPRDSGARVLNNLVVELLNIRTPQTEPSRTYAFTNPRDGWVFFSTTASTQGGGRARLVLDSSNRDETLIVHSGGVGHAKEAMRRLPAGDYTLSVYCEADAFLQGLVVRAIPEMIYPGLGYGRSPLLAGYPRYNWQHLKDIGMLDNINVILERRPRPDMDVEAWKEQGKKLLTREGTSELIPRGKPFTADWAYEFLAGTRGFKRPDRDGIIMSEFDAKSQLKEFPALTEAVRRLFQKPEFRGKVFYPYANVLCGYGSGGGPGTDFARELIAAGSKVVEERYVAEQPTEDAAWQYLNDAVRQVVLLYQAAIPDCAKHIILNLGYMSVPAESLDVNPGVDYKVFMDMQFNMVANDPAFKGLYGIMWYHSAYADEEILRWSVKLFRHYYIEGRRERLSRDPYILPHIQNGDFVDGTSGWTLAPAEEGSMDVKSWTGYGYLEGRYTAGAQGDTFLRTKRSAKGPNRFSQQLKKLEPGRLYSLKMFTADYQELLQGKSVKQRHQVGIDMKGVELVPDKSLQERCGSGIAGHTRGPFTRKNQLWLTYHRLVFRATSTEGTLTISDWASDKGPGGPIGRELIHNFVQFQPYLEE